MAGLALPTAEATALPSIRLISPAAEGVIELYPRGHYSLDLPLVVASTGGPFEVWAQRPAYDQPVGLNRVERDAGWAVVSSTPVTDVPEPDLRRGLTDFFEVTLAKRNGTILKSRSNAFCPGNGTVQRIDDQGPTTPRYTVSCWASPFTRGLPWGIDDGWAVGAQTSFGSRLRIDPGTYRVTVSVNEAYRTAFGIAPEDAEVSVLVEAVDAGTFGHRTTAGSPTDGPTVATEQTSAPIVTPPDSALPDIEALPAWGISVRNRPRSGRSFLSFGATAWNAGPGDLVVEGFRDPSSLTMDAFQYFYDGDTVVGKLPAGTLEYDNRDGHDHWHFRDFAAYSLLDAEHALVADSGKEAFCLAPTDPIDLTVDNAEWSPWLTDLGTACGESDSLWIREVLETGWGDTYTQYRPGQSFDITDLPNGVYYIKVLANPDDVLSEASDLNNVALRKVKLHGKPGQRWVEVPPYLGIDTEQFGCGRFC
jgi:hypothetical protein